MQHQSFFLSTSSYREQHGFTLIELLTVIAIVGILAAALLPTLAHIRETGHTTRCETNLKNLAAGVINFANDTDGYMPLARPTEVFDTWSGKWSERTGWVNWVDQTLVRDEWRPGSGRHQQRTPWSTSDSQRTSFEQSGLPRVRWWDPPSLTAPRDRFAMRSIREGSLWPYVRRDISTYLCPAFKRSASQHGPVRSYVMNGWFSSERNIRWIESSSGISPSRLLLFADLPETVIPPPGSGNPRQIDDGQLRAANETIGALHRGRAQVIFVDGHVESFEYNAVNPHPAAATWAELVSKLCRGEL